jgi:thiamine-phosphate pyrophosphorylase
MTDERMGERLWAALDRLPRGSGVVFRHYGLAPEARRDLFRKVAKVARKRNLILVRAGEARLGAHEAGIHNFPRKLTPGLRTAAAHDRRDAIAAIRRGADLLFVSPVFATKSHPQARALGRAKFGLLIRGLDVPVIALGGMNAKRAKTLPGIHGWAGIDAFS